MKPVLIILCALYSLGVGGNPSSAAEVEAFKSRLLAATTRHLNLLLAADGSVGPLKGKTANGQEALAFYLVFEITGDQRYRRAALDLADRVLKDMRATRLGVLPINLKTAVRLKSNCGAVGGACRNCL